MFKDYMGIISLNEDDKELTNLTASRPLASIPIGGRYRLIDFVISNMVNANITNVGIYTQSNSRSLLHHLQGGKPWDLDRSINGLFLFNFNFTYSNTNDIYLLKDNIDRSEEHTSELQSRQYLVCRLLLEKKK